MMKDFIQRSITRKVLLVILTVILVDMLGDHLFSPRLAAPLLDLVEEQQLHQGAARGARYLDLLLEEVARHNSGWSSWDATYDFAGGSGAGFIADNITDDYFRTSRIDLFQIYDRQGEPLFSFFSGLDGKPSGGDPAGIRGRYREFASLVAEGGDAVGLFMTKRGLLLLSVAPILHSDGSGPPAGLFFLGRRIGPDVLADLGLMVSGEFRLLKADQLPGNIPALRHRGLNGEEKGHYLVRSERRNSLYVAQNDIFARPSLLMLVSQANDHSLLDRLVVDGGVWNALLVGSLIVAAMLLSLTLLVIRPLRDLVSQIKNLHAGGYSAPGMIRSRSSDEIGVLAEEFNVLLNKLEKSRKKNLIQSYYAGLGESSALRLHSLRNTLTPLTIGIDLIRIKLQEFSFDNFRRALAELKNRETPEDRRASLQEYLDLATDRIVEIFADIQERLDRLIVQSGRIEKVLAEQKKFEAFKPPLEEVRLRPVVDEVISRLNLPAGDDLKIRVDPGLDALEPLEVERIFLMQILENVIENAVEAVQLGGPDPGLIEIFASREEHRGIEQCHIMIVDNGRGIAPEVIRQIFNRDYSSKAVETAGVGLHWCANTLNVMQGRIRLESDGEGRGSRAHILLPMRRSS